MPEEVKTREDLDSAAERMLAEHTDLKQSTDEHRAALEDLKEQIRGIENRIAVHKSAHVTEQGEKPISMSRLVGALARAKAGLSDPWKDAGYEREVIDAHERTAMIAGQDSLGGYWVPEQYLPQEFVDVMRANVVVYSMGARNLTGLTGSPVVIPRKTGNSTAYWVAENAAITESNMTAGQINMEPHACAALCKMSNRLIMLSNPSVESMVQQDIAASLALKIEYAAIRGAGASGEPLGVKSWPGINSTSTASINVTNANAMTYTLEADDSLTGNLAWLMNPRVWSTITGRYRTKSTEFFGDPQRGPGAMPPANYIGYPVYKSTQVKATGSGTSDVYFGDWSQLVIGQWAGVSFAVSTEADTAFAANQTWIRAIAEVDCCVRNAESFCVNSSVTD